MKTTLVRAPDPYGRANAGTDVGYLGSDGTFYTVSEWIGGPKDPIGSVDRDNQVLGGWPPRQVGFLSNDGLVNYGSTYDRAVEARVVGSELLSLDGEVLLVAEGNDPARALAATWLLVHRAQSGKSSPGVLPALATAAAAIGVAVTAAAARDRPTAQAVPSVSRATTAPPKPRACTELRRLRLLVERQNRYAIGEAPLPYLLTHLRKRALFKFNPETLVEVKDIGLGHEWGVGIVVAVSNDPEYGRATKLYPSILVEYWDGSQSWRAGVSMLPISDERYSALYARDPRRVRPLPDFSVGRARVNGKEPSPIIGFRLTDASAVLMAGRVAGLAPMPVLGHTRAEIDALIAKLPRGGEGRRVLVIVSATGKLLKYAVARLSEALRAGVDIAQVAICTFQSDFDEIGLAPVEEVRTPLGPPKVLDWSEGRKGRKLPAPSMIDLNDPARLPKLPGDLTPPTERVYDAWVHLVTGESRDRLVALIRGNKDVAAEIASKMHSVSHVILDGYDEAPSTPAPHPDNDVTDIQSHTAATVRAAAKLTEEQPMDAPNSDEYWTTAAADARARKYDLGGIEVFRPAAAQEAFELIPGWTTDPQLLPDSLRGALSIDRVDLFAQAAQCRSGQAQWTDLLRGVYAWGWARTQYGPARLRRVLDSTDPIDIEARLTKAISTLTTNGAIASYWELNNHSASNIKHFGPSFFTKFLYFAGTTAEGAAPLILDRVVARNLNRIMDPVGTLRSTGWTTREYALYLAAMAELTAQLRIARPGEKWTPDAVELALYST